MSNKKVEVTLSKSTKYNGELVTGGSSIKVTEKQRDIWLKAGVIVDGTKVKEIVKTDEKIVSENEQLKTRVSELETENEQLKTDNAALIRKDELKAKTVDELTEYAKNNNINLGNATKEDAIINAILKSESEKPDLLGGGK